MTHGAFETAVFLCALCDIDLNRTGRQTRAADLYLCFDVIR